MERLASKEEELLDELIADNDYDPLNPSQRRLKSRLRKGLRKVPPNDFSDNGAKAVSTKPSSNCHQYATACSCVCHV